MLAQGVPIRVVMDVLGPSQMATTVDLYSHVMSAAYREVADLVDEILRDGPSVTSLGRPSSAWRSLPMGPSGPRMLLDALDNPVKSGRH